MLIDRLRQKLGDAQARSFQLQGEDLAILSGDDLFAAGQAWRATLESIAPEMRAAVLHELETLQREAQLFLRKYNRSVHTRIAGYVELARRCRFAYHWPVVAIFGIEQVLLGMKQNRWQGVFGSLAARLGRAQIERLSDANEDILRRTNRGIFADSAPVLLIALRAHALREAGEQELATVLTTAPIFPLFDADSLAILRALYEGLGCQEAPARFAALGALTVQHFAREQAIFSFHLGVASGKRQVSSPRSVQAPVVRHERARLERFTLPHGFDLRDHEQRVAVFTRAFVDPIIANQQDYRSASQSVIRRWGHVGETFDY